MQFFKKYFGLFIVLIFSFWAVKPLFVSGFFPIHDNTQIARVFEMGKVLGSGVFPVRFVPDLGYGYGYPIFNYYAPLAYYVGAIFTFLGFDALIATKLMMFVGIVLAGVFMYFLAREFFGEYGGVLSALFYIFAPYHAVNIYVRGDVAEFWAYAFIPLAFLGFYKIFNISKTSALTRGSQLKIKKFGTIGALGFAGVILSHNLSAFIVTPFLFAACLVFVILSKKETRISIALKLTFYVFLGLAISAFYWIPAILEMNYTNVLSQVGGGADFRDHFVCLGQLWTSIWGYGGSTVGCNDGLSFMIGKYHIILSVFLFLSAIFIFFSKKYLTLFENEKWKIVTILISFVGFFVSIFLTLEISRPIWELIPAVAFIQYPWRFLMLAVFFASFVSGASIWIIGKFIKNNILNFALTFFLIFWIVAVSAKFFVPQIYLQKEPRDYTNLNVIKWTTSLISDEYLPKNFSKPKNITQIANFSKLNSESTKIAYVNRGGQDLSLGITAYKDIVVILPVAYFPAWQGFLDGKSIVLKEAGRGISINLPPGSHTLKLSFSQTGPEMLGNIISVIGILVLFIDIIQYKKKYE
jgi:uncharacterized membrane protein